ncbi:MAG TPA: MmgE/PrpD family protein, partial [Beijerinckiaceae bacterium]|nr:MmgE/PrpD family protein [Beijerinckiaceae bacterium]
MAPDSFLMRFARWANSLRHESIPQPVIDKTKLLLLDTIGCALTGSQSRAASGTRATVEMMGGAPQATLIGTSLKTSVFNAALANTAFIRSLEINDIMGNDPTDGSKLGGHPSDNVSTVLAVGEWKNCSGREALTAIVLAYEVFGRAQRLLERGLPWDHTTIHAFASVVAAARLLRLDEAQFANALGLVAAHCPIFVVVRRGEISDAKFMSSAFGAQLGVQAAVLAMNGVSGPVGTFEDDNFKNALFPNRDENEWIKPFGPKFMVEGVTIKAYPSLDTGQALVEAACRMSRILKRRTDDIARIDVTMVDIPMVVHQMNDPGRRNPKLQAAATHSFYFLAAVPLIDGTLTPNTFETGERWLDPDVIALMDKVSLSVDASWLDKAPGGMPVTYAVTLKDGQRHEVEVPYAPGHQYNMMTR